MLLNNPFMPRYLDAFLLDAKFALRSYRRSPGFTLAALLALSLGIGATTAVFSMTDRILFRELPYRAGNRLVSFGMLAIVVDDGEFLFANDYKDLSPPSTPFQSVTSWSGVDDCDVMDSSPLRQRCAEVDWNFLAVLGIRPILGDAFSRTDVDPGAPRKAILSYGIWQRHFARDQRIVGKTIQIDGSPARIVGVLPASFDLPTLQHADLLIPQVILPAALQPGATRVLRVIGRLKKGMTLPAARAQLSSFFQRILTRVPAPFRKEVQFRVRSMRDRQMEGAQMTAWTLLAAAIAMLLISCANVANLLFARAAGRQNELAIRSALGIGSGRLLQQMLTESLLLALVGGGMGCLLSIALLRLAALVGAAGIPHLANASLDGRVLVASLALTLIAGVLSGLAPALRLPHAAVLGSARSVAPRSSTRLKNFLVAIQIAVSTVLLAAAGLLVRSLWNLETQPLGMTVSHVLTAQLVLPSSRYKKPEERIAFFNQVEQRLAAIPGIRAFGVSDSLPPGGWQRSRPLSSLQVADRPKPAEGTGGLVNWRYVSPGYFAALRIPVLAGRPFNEEDRQHGMNLCILSRSLTRRLFPGRDPIGQQLKMGTFTPVDIVGIVPDVKNSGLSAADSPEYYILRTHSPDDTYLNGTGPVAQRTLSIVFRSAVPNGTLAARTRREVAALDPTLPVQIQTMRARLSELTARPRFTTFLLLSFAGVGLFLAAVGLYGTVSYLVVQRTHEIGIRMSLGATPAEIARLTLAHSAKWTLAGASIGIFVSVAITRLLSSLLFRVSARDPLTLFLAVACLLLVALLATAIPARRAAVIDPMRALRTNH